MNDNMIYEIKLSAIQISEQNVRKTNAEKELEELMENIKKYGLFQPVVLLGNPGKPPYKLIVGQRRFLAHKRLKKETIKAVFAGDLLISAIYT